MKILRRVRYTIVSDAVRFKGKRSVATPSTVAEP